MQIESGGNLVGGATPLDGNVISGNSHNGVLLTGAGATGNTIHGNRIGINIDGTAAVANGSSGVLIDNAPSNIVGGPGTGNAIGGNGQQGIRIAGLGGTGNLVQGNAIGFDLVTGTPAGNRDGVRITDAASSNQVGGGIAGEGNEIAYNGGRGVWISDGLGNTVSRNSIHDNPAGGISLGGQAATPNDTDDADSGANNLQNFPELASVILNGENLDVDFLVDSTTANSAYDLKVEFFITDSSGAAGETFLGETTYAVANAGDRLEVSIPAGAATAGTKIVATATDIHGNTSEFSAAATVAETLQAAGGESHGGAALSASELAPIVHAAIDRLAAIGISAEQFQHVEFSIVDLPRATLASSASNSITIDVDAAGHDWFIDATTYDDSEFTNPKSGHPPRQVIPTLQSIDLLTVVMHELGHVAGLNDLYDADRADDLMYWSLEPGVRNTSIEADADAAFAELSSTRVS